MKLYTKTFGCQMNFADSDEMGRHLKDRGFTAVAEEENADAFLINTCTVRDLAEHKAASYIGRLKDWKKTKPDGVIIVTGCAAERAKVELKKRFSHIDLIVGAKDIEQFPQELDSFMLQRGINEEELVLQTPSALSTTIDHNRPSNIIQFVTIMRGCNYNCSYCIVPSVRGREVYIPIEEILANVRTRVNEGAKEIWLLGQTVNSYKPTVSPVDGYDFSDLLRDVNKVPGLERVRFMSPHPYYLTPKLIDAMGECEKVCEHMHLPVQSGSDSQLKKMKRNYTRELYLKGVAAIKAKIPGVSITTDIIVGFPGETDDDFKATPSLVEEVGFDSAYCFKYSPRPGTVSATYEDDVSMETKEARVNELLQLTEKIGVEKARQFIGSTQEVLVEEDKGNGVYRGKTRSSWKVRFHDEKLQVGQTVKATIVDQHSRELHGQVVIPAKAGIQALNLF